MSRLEKMAKKGFWLFLEPVLVRLPHSQQPPPSAPSLLLLRPDRLGDFILSAPALVALIQQAGPSARVTLVAGEPNESIARLLFPKITVWTFRKNFFSRTFLFLKILFTRFDAVVDLHSYPFSTTSGLMALASGTSRRVGFVHSAEGDGIIHKIFNWGVENPDLFLHESQKSMLLSRRLYPGAKYQGLNIVFKLDLNEARTSVDEVLRIHGLGPKDRLIGIHPTLLKKDNRWDSGHFAELINYFPARPGLKWLVLHGKGEESALENFKKTIEDRSGVIILPTNDLFSTLAAAQRCSVVVAGDSGLTHACSLVTRVIALFGPSDPRQWGPLKIHRPLVIRSRDNLCDSIAPEKVAEVLKKVLTKR